MTFAAHKSNMTAVIILFCLSAGAFAAGKKVGIQSPQAGPLVERALIQQAGWEHNWQLTLPVKTDEQIDQIFAHDKYLYALTDTNILFCIDREKGRTLHAIRVCQRDLPLCSPFFYEGKLGFIAGNQFHVFDPAGGIIEQAEAIEQVGNIFSCGASRNEEFIYLTGSDNRLHVISPDGFWQAFTATADNDSAINSVKATDSIVIFSTLAGNVVGMNPGKAEKYWQYDISGKIKAPLVVDSEFVYVAGLDAKLYKLVKQTGKMAWDQPFHGGAPLRDEVVLGSDVVYVYNDLNGLYAVNKETGKTVWNIPTGRQVVCEADKGEKAFIFARPGVLKVLDNAAGKELYSVNFSQVQRYAVNTEDSVMYLGDTAGRLMSVTVK